MWGLFCVAALALVLLARRAIRTGGRVWSGLPMARLREDLLREHVVVVTGSTSGIGLAVVEGLLRCGAHVVMVAVTQSEGDAAVTVLSRKCAAWTPRMQVAVVDLRDPEAIAALPAAALQGRRVARLVYCAGVCGRVDDMVAVNVLGAARLTVAMLPHLTADARLVYVGSDSHALGIVDPCDVLLRRWRALEPSLGRMWPVMVAYGTTKLTLILWLLEWSRAHASGGVRYFVVQPGFVDTPMGEQALHAGSWWLRPLRFVKRALAKTPWEGAQTVLHLATCAQVSDGSTGNVAQPWANNAPWKWVHEATRNRDLITLVYRAVEREM